MPKLPAGYIDLTGEEKLYALRCVAQVEPATASKIGIAERALSSLAMDGLLTYYYITETYEVSERGRKVLDLAGGFKYG